MRANRNAALTIAILSAFTSLGIFYLGKPSPVQDQTAGDAVIIVIKVVLALIGLGVSSYVVLPTMYNLKTDQSLWQNVTGTAIEVRDSLYDIFVYMPLIVGAMVILWGFMSASRRGEDEA